MKILISSLIWGVCILVVHRNDLSVADMLVVGGRQFSKYNCAGVSVGNLATTYRLP